MADSSDSSSGSDDSNGVDSSKASPEDAEALVSNVSELKNEKQKIIFDFF
jgi:hypothetical protein